MPIPRLGKGGRLRLREGGPPMLVRLDGDADARQTLATALAASGAVHVERTTKPREIELSTTNRIGVVQAGGVQLIIAPKIPIARVIFLLGYARNPDHWRKQRVLLKGATDLPEALAHALVQLTSRAFRRGLLKGYTEIETTLPVLRGRIREADQLRTHLGRSLPLELRYDEFTVDIPENRLLLAAAIRLLRMPGVPPPLRIALHRMRQQLADVTPPTPGAPPAQWRPSRLNDRYRPALAIAELILAGHSFEQLEGDVTVSGFLVNMATVFEDFTTTALAHALRPWGGTASCQHRLHLDEAEQLHIYPDFVWLREGRPVLVADAKYKAESPSGFPRADLYQLLAYCTVLGLPVGHLVYAKGNEPAAEHVVRGAGTRIIAHALELNAEPDAVLADVRRIAEQMRAAAG